MRPGNTKFVELEELLPIRVPLLRALAAALRRTDPATRDRLAPRAEELARLWAALPEKTRAGDAADVTEAAGRMEELLDELMKAKEDLFLLFLSLFLMMTRDAGHQRVCFGSAGANGG